MIIDAIFAQAANLVTGLVPSGNDVNSPSAFSEDAIADIDSADTRQFEIVLVGQGDYWNTGMDAQTAIRFGWVRFAVHIKYTDVGGSRRMHATAAADMQGIADKVQRGMVEYGQGVASCITDGESTYQEYLQGEQTMSLGTVPFRVEFMDTQVTA